MCLENKIFNKVRFDAEKLKRYGFVKNNDDFLYDKSFMNNDFKAIIKINLKNEVSGKVIDILNNEEYLLLNLQNSSIGYVETVKTLYEEILTDIKEKCTIKEPFIFPQTNRINKLIYKKWQINPDYPWINDKKYSDAAVYRNQNNKKWFALIMNIDKSKLDKELNGLTEIINLKLDKEEIQKLIEENGYFPAYHMNKKNWITIILNDTLQDEKIIQHIEKSFNYTLSKK